MNICGNHCPTAADGGAGIRMGAGTSVLVTGPDYAGIIGGYNGTGDLCGDDGTPGNGIVVHASATLRVSGATVRGGEYVYPCGAQQPVAPIIGPFAEASPADPTLTIYAAVEVQPVTFTVQGEPGSTATLWLGRQLVVVDLAGVVEDQLVVPLRTYDLGTLPASGTATHLLQFSPAWPEGAIFVAQAKTTSVSGAVALSQSMPLTVR